MSDAALGPGPPRWDQRVLPFLPKMSGTAAASLGETTAEVPPGLQREAAVGE